MERDVGWYLMSGAVETPKAKAIRYLVNKCSQELRPIAEDITRAFAIPDAVLAAPIAFLRYIRFRLRNSSVSTHASAAESA